MAQPERAKISVLGAGSFGTALAYSCAVHGNFEVSLLCRSVEQARSINETHFNSKRFTSKKLPNHLTATTDLEQCLESTELIIHCVPAQHTHKFIESHYKLFPKDVPVVCTSKGIDTYSGNLMSQVIEEAFKGRATNTVQKRAEIPLAFMSGPSFAAEIMELSPVAVVVASYDSWCLQKVQTMLNSKYFRVYSTDDVIGVEVGGALKNPLAIGTGCVKGLGYGQSSIAGVVTRGCLEMSELAIALGGRKETLQGLSGFGDLMLTCYSDKSRNNRFGQCLAKGMSTDQAIVEIGEVVEGFPTAIEVGKLAKKYNLNLPLFKAVEILVKGSKTPKEIFHKLMEASPKEERFIG